MSTRGSRYAGCSCGWADFPRASSTDNALVGAAVERLIAEDRPDLLHLSSGYLLTLSPLSAARAHAVRAVVSLADMWVLCPRIQMLRSDGSLSTAPIDPGRCVRCLAEEQRRYRIPGRVAPRLMAWFWRRHTGRIRHIEDRFAFLRGGLAGADAIICRSAFLRSMLVRAGAVEGGRVTPLTPGRSSAQAGPVAAVKSASDRLRLGYLGQIAPHKGVHVLVDAVGRLPGARLTLDLHGDWNQFPDYAREIRRAAAADARIRCRPPFAGDERLSELHADLDVLVVPSIWYECSPNVILESFVYKTPVVASNLGGITELDTGRRGRSAVRGRQLRQPCRDDPAVPGRSRAGRPSACGNFAGPDAGRRGGRARKHLLPDHRGPILMRVLFVAPYVPSRVRVRSLGWLQALAGLGHRVHLVALRPPEDRWAATRAARGVLRSRRHRAPLPRPDALEHGGRPARCDAVPGRIRAPRRGRAADRPIDRARQSGRRPHRASARRSAHRR